MVVFSSPPILPRSLIWSRNILPTWYSYKTLPRPPFLWSSPSFTQLLSDINRTQTCSLSWMKHFVTSDPLENNGRAPQSGFHNLKPTHAVMPATIHWDHLFAVTLCLRVFYPAKPNFYSSPRYRDSPPPIPIVSYSHCPECPLPSQLLPQANSLWSLSNTALK